MDDVLVSPDSDLLNLLLPIGVEDVCELSMMTGGWLVTTVTWFTLLARLFDWSGNWLMVMVDVLCLLFDRIVGDEALELDFSSTEILRRKSWCIIAAAAATRPPLLLNCTLISPSSVEISLSESFDDFRLLCSTSSSCVSLANSGGGGGIISLVGLDFGDDLLLSGFSLEISSSPCSMILRSLGFSAVGVDAFSWVGVEGFLIAAAGGRGAGPFSRLMT